MPAAETAVPAADLQRRALDARLDRAGEIRSVGMVVLAGGVTQVQLAARADMTQASLSAIETGRRPLGVERAARLARALRVHPAALLFPAWTTQAA